MSESDIRKEILSYLEENNPTDDGKDMQEIIEIISKKYDVPENIVEQTIAEWDAGKMKVK